MEAFPLALILSSPWHWLAQEVAGDMKYTIVRPGGLKNEPATGRGVLTTDITVCGAISREDVADLVVKALFSEKTDSQVSQPWPGTCNPGCNIQHVCSCTQLHLLIFLGVVKALCLVLGRGAIEAK